MQIQNREDNHLFDHLRSKKAFLKSVLRNRSLTADIISHLESTYTIKKNNDYV